MEKRGHFSLVDLAATLIGVIGLTVGVVLDVDARSMQSQITDIAESVHSIMADQKNQDKEIMILDGFNGGGAPRTINCGPVAERVTQEMRRESGDCEGLKIGTTIVVIGYGLY